MIKRKSRLVRVSQETHKKLKLESIFQERTISKILNELCEKNLPNKSNGKKT